MMTLLLLLGLVLAVGVGAGLTLWRLLYPPRLSADEILALKCSALETYRPMNRLFVEEDFSFLAAHPRCQPGMLKRLRRQRGQVLRLYLRDLRADFERIYNWCRALAPASQDPDFAARITQQAMTFYGLLLVLHVRCSLGWFLHVRVDTADLVGALARLQEAARASLQTMAPQPAFVASRA